MFGGDGVRDILHVDLNAFYASVEQALNPKLKGLPVAVAGDKDKRSGIILTSSYEARSFGVKTAMTIGEAKNLCPNIILIKPSFRNYTRFSIEVMNIIKSFTPDVEQFSIDEAWADVTGCERLFGNPKEIGDKIRYKIEKKLGITASVGVSYCKLMAKMASDMKKPNATTVVRKEDVPNMIWPLPIGDLLGVGRKTRQKLNTMGIFTIGELANSQLSLIEKRFGKNGRYLWCFANGIDDSKVSTDDDEIKGIGNSITTPRDVVTMDEASEVIMALSESVGRRLREHGMEGNVVEVVIKTSGFNTFVRQRNIRTYSDVTYEIYSEAMRLLDENWDKNMPLRLLGVRVSGLKPSSEYKQISFFEENDRQKQEKLDKCVDVIRERYGSDSVFRASLMVNEARALIKTESDEDSPPMNPFIGGGKL